MTSKSRIGVGQVLLTLSLTLPLASCAAIQAQYEAETCTPTAAYAAGVNDARNGKNMDGNYAAAYYCSQDQASLNQSYIEGFQFAMDKIPSGPDSRHAGYECKSSFGNKVCGYNCVESMGTVQCASRPDQRCVANNFGQMACGYSCAKSQDTVKCAQKKNENCVADSFGNVECGRNCRVTPYGIRCGSRDLNRTRE
ncbi:hypothetical protein MK280_06605 [Myxococcota bacterium]|nr:hypothetical protein [Myxococcota bacterium]